MTQTLDRLLHPIPGIFKGDGPIGLTYKCQTVINDFKAVFLAYFSGFFNDRIKTLSRVLGFHAHHMVA